MFLGPLSGWIDSFTAFDITASVAGERLERSDAADDENSACRTFSSDNPLRGQTLSGYEMVVGKKGAKLIAATPEENRCLCAEGL